MTLTRLFAATAALSLMAGVAMAQTPAAVPAPAAPAPAVVPLVASGDIMQTMRLSGQFSSFVKAVDATNLTGLLKSQPNLTIFAPNDAAFAALPPGQLAVLMADKARLQKLLVYHIVNARMEAAKFKGAHGLLPTGSGEMVEMDGSGDIVRVNDATIIQADVMASNGIIHVVNKVLQPAPPAAAVSGAPATATAAAPPSAN